MKQPAARQSGTVMILFAVSLVALLGFVALAVDLGTLYVRKSELQNAADAAALSGARELDGTRAGVQRAQQAAIDTAARNLADFGATAIDIGAEHIRFATSGDAADDAWIGLAAVADDASAAPLGFIKVDTSGIAPGTIATWFARVFESNETSTRGRAVAGKTLCDVLPIFTCTLGAGANHGFVLGQSYPLTANYSKDSQQYIGPGNVGWLDPRSPKGDKVIIGAKDMARVICSGATLCYQAGNVASLTQKAFGPMADALNTRFGVYKGSMKKTDAAACPADTNIKEYTPAVADWLKPKAGSQAEVHWSAYRPDDLAGATPKIDAGKYPGSGTPYQNRSDKSFYTDPGSVPKKDGRRILNIALADCAASNVNGSGNPVEVVAFGRFLMQTQAYENGSVKGFYGEFLGILPKNLATPANVKLFQ